MEDKHDRFLDADQEPRQMLQPIEGYQKMPLVSLAEAVEPIVSCCHDIRRRVFIAMSNCEKPRDGLTQDESASIYLYTMEWEPRDECLYYILNKTLRSQNRNKLRPWFSYLNLILTALYKLPSEKNVIWRGINLDLNREYEVGKSYVWWAFSSCTLSLAVLESDDFLGKYGPRTLFNIECLNGKMIRSHSYIALEDEILLLPATQFIVKSKLTLSANVHIIHLKQVDPLFPLIEPPLITLSVKSKIDLNEKQQTSTTLDSITTSIKAKLDFKEKHETPSMLPSTYVILHSAFENKKKKEQLSDYSHNEKLEQLIGQYSHKDLVKLENKELTDSDIPFVVQRTIIDQKCLDLNISWNKITDIGAEYLGEVLTSNTTLQKLDISGNHLSDKGTRWIAEALHTNRSLTTIDLGRNQINDEGARFLARILYVNLTLKDVCLYTNLIGDNGAQHLAQALTSNKTITLFNIGRNVITDRGITHLAEMLKRNVTITHFYIGENRVTNMGVKITMDALCYNQGLKWLGMECPEITHDCIKYIHHMFKVNKTLTGLCLPKISFSDQDQHQLRAMAKTEQNCEIWFL